MAGLYADYAAVAGQPDACVSLTLFNPILNAFVSPYSAGWQDSTLIMQLFAGLTCACVSITLFNPILNGSLQPYSAGWQDSTLIMQLLQDNLAIVSL